MSPHMLHWSQPQKDLVVELKRKAYKLGIEVGENNHIDTIGWVRTELKAILGAALKAGELREVRQVYEKGKREGVSRRNRHVAGQKAAVAKTKTTDAERRARTAVPAKPKSPATAKGFVERISPQEGVKSTIGVMKKVADDPEARKDLNGLFAGIFDIQERILDLEPEEDMRRTFEKGLRILFEAGWVEGCELASFDASRAVVTLRSTTAIAKAFGNSDAPMCQPVCNLLETIGRRTFGVSVAVTELECCAQGKSACRFIVVPRKS